MRENTFFLSTPQYNLLKTIRRIFPEISRVISQHATTASDDTRVHLLIALIRLYDQNGPLSDCDAHEKIALENTIALFLNLALSNERKAFVFIHLVYLLSELDLLSTTDFTRILNIPSVNALQYYPEDSETHSIESFDIDLYKETLQKQYNEDFFTHLDHVLINFLKIHSTIPVNAKNFQTIFNFVSINIFFLGNIFFLLANLHELTARDIALLLTLDSNTLHTLFTILQTLKGYNELTSDSIDTLLTRFDPNLHASFAVFLTDYHEKLMRLESFDGNEKIADKDENTQQTIITICQSTRLSLSELLALDTETITFLINWFSIKNTEIVRTLLKNNPDLPISIDGFFCLFFDEEVAELLSEISNALTALNGFEASILSKIQREFNTELALVTASIESLKTLLKACIHDIAQFNFDSIDESTKKRLRENTEKIRCLCTEGTPLNEITSLSPEQQEKLFTLTHDQLRLAASLSTFSKWCHDGVGFLAGEFTALSDRIQEALTENSMIVTLVFCQILAIDYYLTLEEEHLVFILENLGDIYSLTLKKYRDPQRIGLLLDLALPTLASMLEAEKIRDCASTHSVGLFGKSARSMSPDNVDVASVDRTRLGFSPQR